MAAGCGYDVVAVVGRVGAHDHEGTAAEHGIGKALADAKITAFADSAYAGAGATVRIPYRRVRYDRATRKFARRNFSAGQKAVNRAHSGLRAPGERANVDLKNWRILRKIRSSPTHTTTLVNAIQTLIIKS